MFDIYANAIMTATRADSFDIFYRPRLPVRRFIPWAIAFVVIVTALSGMQA